MQQKDFKDMVLTILSTPTEDPEYPNPLTFDEICTSLNASAAERFKVGQSIIDLLKENKIVQLGNLYGVDLT